MRSQPSRPLVVASGEGFVQAAEIGLGLGIELRRIEVAQGVGRKITDQPGAPVDVLQAALGVVAGRHAEVSRYFSFQAAGRSATARSPVIRACSSSKRTMMCRL